jgi:hypothetical protein
LGTGLSRCSQSPVFNQDLQGKALDVQTLLQVIDPKMPVAKLKPGDVLKYVVKQKEERSGNAANKDRKNLVAAWNWGMKYLDPPLPGPNPCLVDRMPEVRHPRYVPPEEDFWKIYAVAEGQDKVMLLTFLHLGCSPWRGFPPHLAGCRFR